jgi:hypothetical protein
MNKNILQKIIREEFIKEAYYGSIPGEPETPAGYGGAVDRAKVQQNLSDDIEDLVRFGKLNLDDLSVEIVRANQEIQWDKYQAIDDEVLGDIIRDYQRRRKFYKEGTNMMNKNILKKIIREELQRECGMMPEPLPGTAVQTPSQPPPDAVRGTPETVDLADMSPSDAFGFAWTSAIDQLRGEFPEAAAKLESLSGEPGVGDPAPPSQEP